MKNALDELREHLTGFRNRFEERRGGPISINAHGVEFLLEEMNALLTLADEALAETEGHIPSVHLSVGDDSNVLPFPGTVR